MNIAELFNKENVSNNDGQALKGHDSQYSLHDGGNIFNLIIEQIDTAISSIYIVASWFTDYDLFNAVFSKLENTPELEVKIVLDNNKDNYYLPFKKLVDLGARVRMVKKKSAYGKMHSKFCVFDDERLINGSYNWSKNARNNNDENIIYTENSATVQEFAEQFNSLFDTAIDFDAANLHEIEEVKEEANSEETVVNPETKYEELLRKLIYAQVHSYDEKELRELGRERSERCAGDAVNLIQELDNVYSSFLRDIKISDEQKKAIKSTLDFELERSKNQLDLKAQREISLVDKETELNVQTLERDVHGFEELVVQEKSWIDNLADNTIPKEKERIEDFKDQISQVENKNYRPKLPLYTFIPNLLGLILVFAYCIIFYSSAAYILIFSQADAKEASMRGETIQSPEIFYGDALQNALEKGWMSALFIMLVPCFILSLIFVINKVENRAWRYISLGLAIVFVDAFTAYKVAESIHKIEYLKGQVEEIWRLGMAFRSTDFYLVLVFGLLALLTFELLLGHLFKVFDKRNADVNYEKSKIEIQQKRSDITESKEKLSVYQAQIIEKEAKVKNYQERIDLLSKQITACKTNREKQQHNAISGYEKEKTMLENVTNIYIAKIENETFIYSTIYILDRISNFLRGWKDWLHTHYAVQIAVEKSRQADEQIALWKAQNLTNANSREV